MSKKATEFQKREMSKMYRGKEIFKPLNTGWVDERVACVREWVANIFFYADGKRTNEQDGYTVTCVLPERDYEELAVSVPTLSAELEQCTGNPVVQFDGLTMSIYGRPDDLRIAAKASAVRIVDGKTKT